MASRTVVLLGAGASKPADLPLASELTDRALAAARDSPRSRTLSFVVTAMMLEEVRRGSSGAQKPGIEQVVSAVELLANRASLEVTAFIRDWDVDVERSEHMPSEIGDYTAERLRSALQKDERFRSRGLHSELQQVLTQIIRESQPRRIPAFESLYTWLMGQVPIELKLSAGADVSYLVPIVRWSMDSGGVIATLNYDETIETAAAVVGGEYGRYVDDWNATGELSTPPLGTARLLKIHGSVDWVFDIDTTFFGQPQPSFQFRSAAPDPVATANRRPAIIYGQREKLRAEGPFLQLLEEFRRNIELVDRVLAIGYSFSDAHINTVIRRWLERSDGRTRTLIVVDPFFPELKANARHSPASEREILWWDHYPESRTKSGRLIVVRESCDAALAQATSSGLDAWIDRVADVRDDAG